MKGHPISTRILVRPHEPPQETAGGIIIPDLATERPLSGEVLEVGATVCAELRPGRTVIFRHRAGTDFTLDGVRHFLLEEDEVMAWLEA